jgi:hypothetical protein
MAKHCCDRMRAELRKDELQEDGSQSTDALVTYVPNFDEYGLIIHDGGSSMIEIHFCPWCGTKLPESKRDQWFAELEKRGIDPHSDLVPPDFQSEAWYSKS